MDKALGSIGRRMLAMRGCLTDPGACLVLRWKQYEMPGEAALGEALEAFKHTFADVLDWETARFSTKTVLLHT